MGYMESKMQEYMEAGEALYNAIEEATYRALMRRLGVAHVTITHGLSSYGINQQDTQAIVDEVSAEFNLNLHPVVLKEECLASFTELMDFFSNGKE